MVMPSPRIILVDDHPLMREAIRLIAERVVNGCVVGEAADGPEAIALVALHKPDLAIVDISLKQMSGIETTAHIKEQSPATRVLILSGHSSADFVVQSLKAGADGYLVKDSAPAELKAAITAVLAGQAYLSPGISTHVVAALRGCEAPGAGAARVLSARQLGILRMIAAGKSTKEIAYELGVSTKTVETHRARIMERLDIHDLAGLVVFAMKSGLIENNRRSA
jgi:DNA-binding NarL/FixJ family response regulator